jgi:hypothetical protein
MKNNDALKKHHFWILLGFVPLFVMIAVLMLSSSVGGKIEERDSAIDKSTNEIASKTNPKPNVLIEKLDKMVETVAGKKGGLWKDNWDRQAGIDPKTGKQDPSKNLFTWPNSARHKAVEKMGLKFGDRIDKALNDPDAWRGVVDDFRRPEVYLAEFSNAKPGFAGTGMADKVAPTEFNGTWANVLRHVSTWSQVQLTSDQIWLMLEDIWVQRSLLDAVRSVNAQMGEFRRVKFEKGGQVIDDPDIKATQDPLRRKFQSRTWEVELEVAEKDGQRLMSGKLTNITDRLQLMGVDNIMTLRVWLEPGSDGRGKGVEPFEFRIGGEFLPGMGAVKPDGKTPANTIDIAPLPDQKITDYPNLIPPGKNVLEIVKVEQVFDSRTVPVRRIEAVALGFQDSRTKASVLLTPKFMEPKEGETPTTTPADKGTADPAGGGSFKPGPGGGMGGMDPYRNSRPDSASSGSGGGTVASVIDANKKRYLVVNDQVRRMPVGVVLLVDQSNMEDVLMAFANSPLRFQITQVTWTRFRGSLGGGGGGGLFGGGNQIVSSGPGSFGQGLGGGTDPDERRGYGSPPRPSIPGLALPGSPSSVGGGGPGGGDVATGAGGPGGGQRSPYNSYNPYGMGGGTMTTVSESQLTAGLIELSVYGVVSLYEKYVPPGEGQPADGAAAPKDKDAKDTKDQGDSKEPKDKDKEPKDPMTAPTTEPKKRVRRRAGR